MSSYLLPVLYVIVAAVVVVKVYKYCTTYRNIYKAACKGCAMDVLDTLESGSYIDGGSPSEEAVGNPLVGMFLYNEDKIDEILPIFLRYRASMNIRCKVDGFTPLEAAMRLGSPRSDKYAKMLIDAGAIPPYL